MIHLGDITQICGYDIPLVDCVTGGSPCQDLSVAGKRAGLEGERSGLFMEQIRIVREMREYDRATGKSNFAVRPRFMVWENVPGAFSSGNPKGADFATVIEEIIKICEPCAAVHVRIPDKGWTKCGCYYAEDGRWSIAWRVHDAKFWGVPQRRKRIALVADFGGLCAPEVLFERKGLSRDSEQSETKREETAGGTGSGAESTSWCIKGNAVDRDTNMNGRWEKENASFTLNATDRHAVCGGRPMYLCFEPRSKDGVPRIHKNGIIPTLNTAQGGQRHPCVLAGGRQNRVTDGKARGIGNGQLNQISMTEQANALNTMHDQQAVYIPAVSHSLKAKGNCDFREGSGTYIAHVATARRLTPLECERLQGYPDGWTDIGDWIDSKGRKRHTTDTARYKAIGNSIALPFWFWLLRRISAQYERSAMLESLFDGIGGFPLCWERCNGPGTVLWASEIDEFCIAVTKKRFGGLLDEI